MLHCYNTDKKAELNSDSFADCGKSPTIVRGHRDQSAILTINICLHVSKAVLSVKIKADSSKKEELDKRNHWIALQSKTVWSCL